MFTTAVTEIAIGQIQGYIKPSKAERQAAFELFVELSSRTATVTVIDEHRMVRDVLDNVAQMPAITRDVLRAHGTDSAKDRKDGNVALAAIALRVLNEVVLPRLNRWDPLLRHWEERRPNDGSTTAPAWERQWPELEMCQSDLESMRGEIRAYLDTLARIAGTPALADLVVPNPPGAPIPPVTLAEPVQPPEGADPRHKMVGWVDPVEGVKTMIAHLGHDPNKNDGRRRVSDPAHDAPISFRPDADGELWIDYVSDLGDGIDPTLAVAWQLTRPQLTLPIDRTGELPTPPPSLRRGRLLVMGGDQVYPHATPAGYRNQTILPYQLAASSVQGDEAPRPTRDEMIAIPGNHDWLGGPQHFEDVFVTSASFAGHWFTPQRERYWAVELPYRWWLWGLDTALDDTLDQAQIEYFETMATRLRDGDQVVIVSPVPLWQLRQKREDDYFRIRAHLNRLILKRGARTPLFLAGDSHFFAHYRRVDGAADEHHVTAGGGGAFLQPTHNLPEHVPYEKGATEFKLGQRWPRPVDSRQLGAGAGAISQRQFRLLFLLVGAFHACFALLISNRFGSGDTEPDSGRAAIEWVLRGWLGLPLLFLILAAMIAVTVPNSREAALSTGAKRYGALHGLAQVAVFVGVAAAGRWLVTDAWWWRYVVAPLIGGVLSVTLFVEFVKWINRSIRANDTLAFSPVHLERYKHFLRMRLEPSGDLTVYAIGIDPVGSGWFEALTRPGELIPPYDKSGVPRLHYIWGRTFTHGGEQQAADRERILGKDHADTIFSRSAWARQLLDVDPEKALTVYERNIVSCLSTYGSEHATTTTNRLGYAEALLRTGRAAESSPVLEELLAECDVRSRAPSGTVDDAATITRCREMLAEAYSATERRERAIALREQLLSELPRADEWGQPNEAWLSNAEGLAIEYWRADRTPEAVELLDDVLRGSDPGVLGWQFQVQQLLGTILIDIEPARAIELLTPYVERFGQDDDADEFAVELRGKLAAAHRRNGDEEAAAQLVERNRRIAQGAARFAFDGRLLDRLAEESRRAGDGAHTVAVLEQLVRDLALNEPASAERATKRLDLAVATARSGDRRDAILQLRCLRSDLSAGAPHDPAIVHRVVDELAAALVDVGELDQAAELLDDLESALLGLARDDWRRPLVRALIAEIHFRRGDRERGLDEMRNLLEATERVAGAGAAPTWMLLQLVSWLRQAGRTRDAIWLVESRLGELRTTLGERSPQLAQVVDALASSYFEVGDVGAAFAAYSACADILRADDPGGGAYAYALGCMADAAERMGDDTGSRTLRQEALDIVVQLHGDDHPWSLDARRRLAAVHERLGDHTLSIEQWRLVCERLQLGEPSAEVADRARLARLLARSGDERDLAESTTLIEQVLRAADGLGDEHLALRHDVHLTAAEISMAAGDASRAAAFADRVHRWHLARPDADPIEAVETQLVLARALLALGRSDAARPVADAAVAATAMLARDERRRVAAEMLRAEIDGLLDDGGLTAASLTPE